MSTPARIEIEHVYTHPVATVWRAVTDPEKIAKWWAPGDLRPIVGHQFHMDMGPWGKQACEMLAVEEGRLLSFLFSKGGLNTTITIILASEGSGTRLTLVHEGFDLDSPMAKQAFDGMKAGWPKVVERIAAALG